MGCFWRKDAAITVQRDPDPVGGVSRSGIRLTPVRVVETIGSHRARDTNGWPLKTSGSDADVGRLSGGAHLAWASHNDKVLRLVAVPLIAG